MITNQTNRVSVVFGFAREEGDRQFN